MQCRAGKQRAGLLIGLFSLPGFYTLRKTMAPIFRPPKQMAKVLLLRSWIFEDMKKIKLAIFDFDGTLADSFPFFVSVFNQLAREHRFDTIDLNHACAFRSYSARQMMQHVGMPQWKLPIVARRFMALMQENHHQVPVFEGIGEILRHLHANGIQLAIVTSNSCGNVSAVLGKENMALIQYLESGVSIFGKAPRIARVLRKSRIESAEAIYIGDQVSDLEAARKAKVASGAVAWGYASIDSLLVLRPEHIFYAVKEMKRLAGSSAMHEQA